jgi:hypothetical protein
MSATDWVGLVSGILAIISAIAVGYRIHTKYLIRNFLSELKPNGGSSLKDSVNKIAQSVHDLQISVARLEGRFSQHVKDSDE